MAKTFTLCLIVLITAHISFAQKIRFNDNTNLWITCSKDPYTWMVDQYGNITKPSEADSISKDTLMNGHTWYFHSRYHAWIRSEDTTEQKFYFKKNPGSAEQVFMDFTMAIGDTLHFMNGQKTLTLASIDSVLINGVYHKLQAFSGSPIGATIMEGIGPEHETADGLAYPYHSICCFEHKGQRPVISSAKSWFDNVGSCVTSVTEIAANAKATVSPNPVTPDSRIVLPQAISRGKLGITNALGQTVVSRTIGNETRLSLPQALPAGVYFYRISDEARLQNFTGKFTVE